MGRPSKYPEEFRREAVALALSTEESRASVARRLGVNETTLRNWVADHVAEEARQADLLAVSASEFEELRRCAVRSLSCARSGRSCARQQQIHSVSATPGRKRWLGSGSPGLCGAAC